MPKHFTYQKKEKLKSRKLLEQVFSKGHSFLVFPVKIFFLPLQESVDFPVKTGVGVSSRNFKKAVDRNRIKRLLRENYRTNKQPLYDAVNKRNLNVAVFLLYIDKSLPDGNVLPIKMPLVISKLIKAIDEKIPANP